MGGFEIREVMKNVFHIRDEMGVYMTLLTGRERALLVDTGYGLSNVGALVRQIAGKPVEVILTHAHHDHALGARWFEKTHMSPADGDAFADYTAPEMRARVARQAAEKGISVPEDYLTAAIPQPLVLSEGEIDLGGLTAQVILCPGHTPGSAMIYVPERRLLLTGDNWNPCTWLFFPEAAGARTYRENMSKVMRLPFEQALCPHREALYPRSEPENFLNGLTDEALLAARPVDMGWPADTREAVPAPGQQFVFDYSRMNGNGGEGMK